jgi:hypothetical protein
VAEAIEEALGLTQRRDTQSVAHDVQEARERDDRPPAHPDRAPAPTPCGPFYVLTADVAPANPTCPAAGSARGAPAEAGPELPPASGYASDEEAFGRLERHGRANAAQAKCPVRDP